MGRNLPWQVRARPFISPVWAALLVSGAVAFWASAARTQSSTGDPTFTAQVSVEQVLVPVVVTAKGRFVDDLELADFRLYVDGRRAEVTSFERSRGAPVHTLLLQDLSGSMGGPKLSRSQSVVEYLLSISQAGDRYSLATFAASGVAIEPEPAAYQSTVRDWMQGWKAYGKTGIHDAIAKIPELISADSAWRSAVLLLTDGNDNASHIAADEAREIARRADVPIHILSMSAPTLAETSGRWSEEPLRLLAWVTGGEFHSLGDPASVSAASEAFMRQLRSQYILAFSTTGVGRARARKIRVEVRGRNRRVSSRREYLGTAPAVVP